MSQTSRGEHKLKSGNVFQWEMLEVGRRGAISGGFKEQPSADDQEESIAFVESMTPKGANVNGHVVVIPHFTQEQGRALIDSHVLRGSSRN